MEEDIWESPMGQAYLLLFNAMTDALEAMARSDYGTAGDILRQAQQDGEEILTA